MKTWVFFKLRMLQLKYDKTALFFSYIFPVLLLIGIGYANRDGETLVVHFSDFVATEESSTFIDNLKKEPLLKLEPIAERMSVVDDLLKENEIRHYLVVLGGDADRMHFEIRHNTMEENAIENSAVDAYLQRALTGNEFNNLVVKRIKSDKQTSYLQILLPGLIGMTLLLIGLNGFGNVLIEEQHRGLFKNIKTISASPIPFLAGLFLSRLVVCYSVAIVLFLIGVMVFNMSAQVNYLLVLLVVTLGTIAFLGLGLMLSTISPSVSAFTGIVNFVQLPFVVLGGVFFSITAFPDWLQLISNAIPLTSMNMAMQKIIFDSSAIGLAQISNELMVLTAWCLATLAISYRRFKW